MADTNGVTQLLRLTYPKHLLTPEDFVRFVEIGSFSKHWKQLGLDDDDLLVLQTGIMAAPRQGAVVKGTGGLRKLRYRRESLEEGKSGGVRVYYAFLEEFSIVLLMAAYAKSRKEDLTIEQRELLSKVLIRIERILGDRGNRPPEDQ